MVLLLDWEALTGYWPPPGRPPRPCGHGLEESPDDEPDREHTAGVVISGFKARTADTLPLVFLLLA